MTSLKLICSRHMTDPYNCTDFKIYPPSLTIVPILRYTHHRSQLYRFQDIIPPTNNCTARRIYSPTIQQYVRDNKVMRRLRIIVWYFFYLGAVLNPAIYSFRLRTVRWALGIILQLYFIWFQSLLDIFVDFGCWFILDIIIDIGQY